MHQEKDLKNWYESLSRVESLTKFVFHQKDANRILAKTKVKIGCKHKFKVGDTLWLSKETYDVFCNKCASLLQFSECIRKYVLETENDEVIDFLFPWYRNYFHRGDPQKYHKYIAKYNLSRLFVTQDVLPDYNMKEEDAEKLIVTSDQNEIKHFLKRINMKKYYTSIKQYPVDDLDELKQFSEDDLIKKLDIIRADHRAEILEELEKLKNEDKHIRHLRKFAGSCLLGPWDILRNLNIIRSQLQSLFKFIDDDHDNQLSNQQQLVSLALMKAVLKNDVKVEDDNEIISCFKQYYKQFKNINNEENEEKKENDEQSWWKWKDTIEQSNRQLQKQLGNSNREQLLELTSSFVLEDNQKKTVSSLLSSILNNYQELKQNDNNDKKQDEDTRYYREFEKSWHKTPNWWCIEHDILLLELALKFNWNKDQINKELTDASKKLYYQQLLQKETETEDKEDKEDIDENKGNEEKKEEEEEEEEDDVKDVEDMLCMLKDIDFHKLEKHKQAIIEWFETDNIGTAKFKTMNRKEFGKQLSEKLGDKKVKAPAGKLFNAISEYPVKGMINILNEIDLGKLKKHKQTIIEWFKKDGINTDTFTAMKKEDFVKQIAEKCKDKKLNDVSTKLFKNITSILEIKQMIDILNDIDLDKLTPHKQKIVEWFEKGQINKQRFSKIGRKKFMSQITEQCGDKKLKPVLGKLFKSITTKLKQAKQNKQEKEWEQKEEEEEEKIDDFPDILRDDEVEVDFEYRGYQEFQVWCDNWRNIQHRLRFLTFIICKYLNECKPSIIEIRIPEATDRVPQYDINSFVFLNGYIKKVHLENCMENVKDLADVNTKNAMITELATKKDENDKRIYLCRKLRQVHESGVIKFDGKSIKQIFKRDPFMTRDLDFELEDICKSFDLLEYGVEMAFFLIKLLARKQIESLWSALGIVCETMPYEKARFVLSQQQEDLRHGDPKHLKQVCDRIRRGSKFDVHICLFLAEYMEKNAKQDLARYDKWNEFSKYYESEAGKTINDIESDHLLSVLMDIPLSESGKQKVPLLDIALKQNRSQFLNNERINAVLKHVWQTPSGLDPNVPILRKQFTSGEVFKLLLDQPFHFYLTPMGFNSTIKSLHLLYVLTIFIFLANRIYLDDAISYGEWFLWSLNIGYFVYEIIEAYGKGLRDYFTLAGWINWWDLQISFIWIMLFCIRMLSMFQQHKHYYKDDQLSSRKTIKWQWVVAQAYMVFWALQTASLSARSLVLFQTSTYFGVLLRMMKRLIAEMMRFLFVLAMILVGFVFGLYYIQGGYVDEHIISVEDWYVGFRYLFQLTVGAGDFAEIEDIVESQITAQLFTILYIIFATILMMNLLIALMTTTFEQVYSEARTESSFAIAEMTFDLSHRSRFMPAPICIYVIVFALLVHILNFFPALLCPKTCNIYNCVNHYQYNGLVGWKCSTNGCGKICNCLRCKKSDHHPKKRFFLCCKSRTTSDDIDHHNVEIELKVKESGGFKDVYKLTTRGRVWKYYASTFFCCDKCTPKCVEKKLTKQRFEIHHIGCYSCIPTELGAKDRSKDKDRSACNGITLNEYAEEYEICHKFSLDPQDTVLLKHLTVDTLFCKHCYRPFDPKNKYNLTDVLLTPFWALSEIISIYLFPLTVWIPLIIVYSLLTLFQKIADLLNDDESEAPSVPDYDRQYFPKETLNAELIADKNNNNQEY